MNFVLATLHDIRPKDAIERMLAVQMMAVHLLAMDVLQRLGSSTNLKQLEGTLNASNKLLRTFTTQMEALNRHRGKVSQLMLVKNVNVSQGVPMVAGSATPSTSERKPQDEERRAG